MNRHIFFKFTLSVAVLLTLLSEVRAASVIDIQQLKREESSQFQNVQGSGGKAHLINLNFHVGALYLLEVQWPARGEKLPSYNLEIPEGNRFHLSLTAKGLNIQDTSNGITKECDLFSDFDKSFLNRRYSNMNYSPVCDKVVFLRVRALSGNSGGTVEKGANFLRNFGPTGEAVIEEYKNTHLDSTIERGEIKIGATQNVMGSDPGRPRRASLTDYGQKSSIQVNNMKVELKELASGNSLAAGEWYSAKNHPGVYASLIRPVLVSDEIMKSYAGVRVHSLDDIEKNALTYMVAFDLSKFTVGWSHGTGLPGVAWSERNPNHKAGMGGPDGFANVEPLKAPGQLNPYYLKTLEAVMCGGFRRFHGVFKSGELASKNDGSYYGFIENGVVLSRLNPGLSTFLMYTNGEVEIKTWSAADEVRLPDIRYARQNGVPLVEPNPKDPKSEPGIPGALVSNWGDGNWSGSATSQRRSARAGACISEQNGKKFLIYGYFSSVNPESMARVFQAYHCQNAMHLDMNSAGQAYLGLFQMDGNRSHVENPVSEMASLNTKMDLDGKSLDVPRYVGSPDNTDFFFITRK